MAFAGTVAVGLDNLVHSNSAAYGAGPALHLPVFDAGRLRANYRANTANIDVAITAYNQAVLAAVQETADQLSDIASLNTSLVEQQKSLDDAEEAFRLATERYNAGPHHVPHRPHDGDPGAGGTASTCRSRDGAGQRPRYVAQ